MHILNLRLLHTRCVCANARTNKGRGKTLPVEEDIWLLEQTFSDYVAYRGLSAIARAMTQDTDSNVAFMQISSRWCVCVFFSLCTVNLLQSFFHWDYRTKKKITSAYISAVATHRQTTLLIITVIVCSHNITNRTKLVFFRCIALSLLPCL